MASAIAENAAIMPAVDMPSELTTTITSATYNSTVIIEMTNVAAALSSRERSVTLRTIMRTIFKTTSPNSAKAIVRTITSPPSHAKLAKKSLKLCKSSSTLSSPVAEC